MQEGQYELAAELLRFIVPPGDESGAVGLGQLENGKLPASRSSSGINGQVGHQVCSMRKGIWSTDMHA